MPRDPIAWEATIPGLRPSSPAWRAVTKAVWGTPLDDEERAIFARLSGGREPDPAGHDRVFALKGRRGGGSETIARWTTYEATEGGHHVALAPGQLGVIAVIAPEQKHARELVGYVKGLAALPQVKRHVARVVDAAVTFSNGIEICVVTANEMAVASTYVMLVFDEAARLPGEESATPDKAIIASVLPGMAPVRGAPRRKLVAITSAFVDTGWAFETDRDDFARADADFFVVRGSTESFNPNIDRAWLERERRKDPIAAMREYGDGDAPPVWMPSLVEGWFGATVVDKCVDRGRASSIEPEDGWQYVVTIDAAFSRDNFGIAVAARRGEQIIIAHVDAIHPPPGGTLSPRRCVDHVVGVMRDFGTSEVFLDQYCAPTLIEAFEDRGVEATRIDWTGGSGETSKASRFRAVREAMRDGLVRLPDDASLIRELNRARGRMTQQGHESIDAPGRGVDDRVSAVVMACGVVRNDSGGLPDWAKPGAMRNMAETIQALGGEAFSPNALGSRATAPFPGDAPRGSLTRRDCWNGEIELSGSAREWPAKFTAIVARGRPPRHGRETRQWGDEIAAKWVRTVDAWCIENKLV